MKRDPRLPEPELEQLMERGRIIRPLPDVVRARALARARATVAATAAETALPAPAATAPVRAGARRIAVAASIVLLAGGAGALAALRARPSDRRDAALASPAPPPAIPQSRAVAPEITLPAPAAPEPAAGKVRRPARAADARESYRAELDLLQRAQVAFASRDFAGALVLVAEHGRRFPNGRLAEEREALRIRSLLGSGRGDDARRATATFANRFPRSVLLPGIRERVAAPD